MKSHLNISVTSVEAYAINLYKRYEALLQKVIFDLQSFY